MDEIIVGGYEGFLLGYTSSEDFEKNKLKQTFATHSHTSAVRCISMAGKFLASGGTDDKVVVIDMKTRKEHTVLMNHDGTVNTVVFTHSGTHLLSGSDDGNIIVTRTGNWQIEKIWKKAHGGQPVTAIAVHPTDKLALSIGGDKTLRTWNLVKGRPAFTINLQSKGVSLPTEIKFAPEGDRFSLLSLQNVDVWTISKAGLEKRIKCNSKPSCVQWITNDLLYVGLENGNIISLSMLDNDAHTYSAHKQRVKSIIHDDHILYSASSSGELKVWSLANSQLTELKSMNTGCRITCMSLNKQKFVKKEDPEEKAIEGEKEQPLPSESEDDLIEDTSHEVEEERKPGAFVSISYNETTEETSEPPKKKRRKTNKKRKNKQKNKDE